MKSFPVKNYFAQACLISVLVHMILFSNCIFIFIPPFDEPSPQLIFWGAFLKEHETKEITNAKHPGLHLKNTLILPRQNQRFASEATEVEKPKINQNNREEKKYWKTTFIPPLDKKPEEEEHSFPELRQKLPGYKPLRLYPYDTP